MKLHSKDIKFPYPPFLDNYNYHLVFYYTEKIVLNILTLTSTDKRSFISEPYESR